MTASTLYRDYDFDYNNLLPPLEGNHWRRDGNTPSITPAQAFSTEIGVERAARIGLLGTQAGRGLTCTPLVIPPGCVGGILEVGASIPSGDTRVNIAIYDDSLTTRLVEEEVTFGTSVEWHALRTTLAAGQYFAAIETNVHGQQAKPIVWDVRFTPNFASSGVCSRAFKRFPMRAGILHGSVKTNQVLNRFVNQNPLSRWLFEVTIPEGSPSTKCAVRTWINNSGAPVTTPVTFYVQGEAVAKSASSQADATYSYEEFEVPRRAKTMIVGFRNSQQTKVFGGSSDRGSFFTDAFFPADWDVRPVLPSTSGRVAVLVGDSLTLGATATYPESEGWGAYLETRWPGLVIYQATASQWFQHIAVDAATRAANAQEIAKARPSDVFAQIGVNDYLNNAVAAWSAASFETAAAAWLDAVHAACPGATIWVVSPFVRGGSDTAINGLTMAQVRTAWQNAATNASRVPWCQFKSGTASDMPTTAQVQGDNTHLTTDGHAIAGPAIAAFLGV